jgi:hypothetical protein
MDQRELNVMSCGMFAVYGGIAQLYRHERLETGPSRFRPGPFLEQYMIDFRDVVVEISQRHKGVLPDLDQAEGFLWYLETICTVFGRWNQFNVKIHKADFRAFVDKVAEVTRQCRRKSTCNDCDRVMCLYHKL